MKTRLFLLTIITLSTSCLHAQYIDNYGVNLGLTCTNQLWKYNVVGNISGSQNKEFKPGLELFFMADKELNNKFLVRSELGYIMKGFRNNINVTVATGVPADFEHKDVILNDLALDLGIQYRPFVFRVIPYAIAGLRGDYMVSYRDARYTDPNTGIEYSMYKSYLDEARKFNLGGLIGLGIKFNTNLYFEAYYNPSFTRSQNTSTLKTRDNCFEFRAGFNFNRL
jgi:hypothetical protein